jgi:hypothetical protein
MAKRLMSQKEASENSSQSSTNTTSSKDSVNDSKVEKKTNNNIKYDYLYSTPLKKIKINALLQMAPKKKKINLECDDLIVRGRNLFHIFKSL